MITIPAPVKKQQGPGVNQSRSNTMSEEQTLSADMDDLYSAFQTDEELERNGAPVNYGKCVIDIARAGGSNELYNKTFEAVFKEVRTALDLGDLPESEARRLYYVVYARSVVRRWRFRDVDGQLKLGLGRNKAGEVVEANEQNIIALFTKTHELFKRIRRDAETMELYQTRNREAIAKN